VRLLPLLLSAALPLLSQTTARRLNRYEYNATIRDLLAVPFQPAADFPIDDSGYGFDNIADVLSLSPALMEKYLAAAEKIARVAIIPPTPPPPSAQRIAASDFHFKLDFDGDYDILIAVHGRPDPINVTFLVDGVPAATVPLETPEEKPIDGTRAAEFRLRLGRGNPRLSVDLQPNGPPIEDRSPRPPHLGYVEMRGPYSPAQPPPSESYARVFRCGHAPGHHTLACARTNLTDLARRAYRRPVTNHDIDGLMHFVEQADTIDQGMQLAVEAILVSPRFLFRIEPTDNLDDFQFASRLSYFLWSSLPDEQLFQLAQQHRLRDPEVLHAQIQRMLADPKSRALVENFGGQWLQTRNLDSLQPDPAKFPEFTNDLRRDMKQETQLFFQSILRGDRPVSDFVAANYTFLNQRLAAFYGIPNVEGAQFRRVDLAPDSHRGGMLTQASVLTVSSYPARTSPVIRGKWILQNLLDAAPPPPPPNVPTLNETALGATATVRQRLEQHRANPACQGCHMRMDPLGFGLENYDAIGHWRTHDGSLPIDATGALPSGQTFDGPDALKQLLLKDQDRFAQVLASKLLTFALGRQAALRTVTGNETFSQIVEAIVTSAPFEQTGGQNATR
jgi:Protein of unknown function (DUF1592)/Protein of unknown function (DUF1588)/Protein of unknown function (DUF1587)/Protein of unknown function (DUF1595)/Protein of unknown function (DUF1585)